MWRDLARSAKDRRERRVLCATVLLAIGVPIGAAAWVRARTDDLADRLATAGGVPARIGGVDVDLTGAVRLTDVALGELVAIDAIEASVAMSSLLGGHLRADEIRVERPHVAISVGADGDSDLAKLARRIARRRGGAAGSRAGGVRRIVVSSGTLTATIAGVGQLAADGVELVPDAAGVRVITGPLRLRRAEAPAGLELAFARSAAELSLPAMRFGRVLAVGGNGEVRVPDAAAPGGARTLGLREVSAGRLAPGGALELQLAIDDGGVTRPLGVELSPTDLAVTIRGDHVPLAALASLAPRSLQLADAWASGALIIRQAARGVEVVADGEVANLVIDHPTIAPTPIAVTGKVGGAVAVSPDAIALRDGSFALGHARFAVSGWVRRHGTVSGQLDVDLAQAACADLLASLPAAVRGPLDGLGLTGTLAGHARLAVDLAAPPGEGTTLTTQLRGDCAATAEPPEADVTQLAVTSEQQLADGSRVVIGKDEPSFFALRRLPHYVAAAFVSAEDGRFWHHDGFDRVQIARSLEIDLRERRLARGGSTISQQLVKNAFLTQRRSLDRKVQEAILTWRLESRLDKQQILERYLNIIELGPRTFGIRAAARHWFNLSPRELSIRQAAFLAALTSQPTAMSRRVRKARGLDPASAERVDVVLWAMKRDNVLTAEQYDEARRTPLGFAQAALAAEP